MPLIQISTFLMLYLIGYKLFGAVTGFIISSIFGALSYIYLDYTRFNKILINKENAQIDKNADNVELELIKLSLLKPPVVCDICF
jgi:hypothetical protein